MCACHVGTREWMHTRTAMFTYSKSPNHLNRSEPTNLHILWQAYTIHPSNDLWASLTATWLCDVWCSYICPRSMAATKCSGYIREQDKDYRTVAWENSLERHEHLQVRWYEWLTFADNRACFRSCLTSDFHIDLGVKKGGSKLENFTFWSSVSCAKKRQFCVWSWMDVLVPLVRTTESADYCYLQKHASTKQVFEVVGWKCSHCLNAKSLKLQELKEWISGVLSASLISFSCAWNSVGQIHPLIFQYNGQLHRFPPLYLSAPWRAPLPGFCPSVSGGGWQPFYVAGSSNSLKALVQIKYATLGHSRGPLSQAQWLTLQHLQPS